MAGRTNGHGYGEDDDIRKQYTGYERDKESGLDFAQARYYNSKQGRFTSVDPLTASANVKNPQTFNRYSYVLNSPYKFTDPLGLLAQGANSPWCSICFSGWDNYDEKQKLRRQRQQQQTQAHEDAHANSILIEEGGSGDSAMSASEQILADTLLNSGGYVSIRDDGDSFDYGNNRDQGSETERGGDPHNHGYGSEDGLVTTANVYIPDNAEIINNNYWATNSLGKKERVVLVYFPKLGKLSDVTLAIFHLVNIGDGKEIVNGRRKLGEIGKGNQGEIGYKVTDSKGNFAGDRWTYHFHVEAFISRITSLAAPDDKRFISLSGIAN